MASVTQPPSRYKATITTRVNELKQLIEKSKAKISEFQDIDDIEETLKASRELRKLSDSMSATLTCFQNTWKKWCDEIDKITDTTDRDSEKEKMDDHKQSQSFDECTLESDVEGAVAMIKQVIDSKTSDLEYQAKLYGVKAQRTNTDLQNLANKSLIEDEAKAKKALLDEEAKAKQALIDTIANEARAKQETIERESKAKQALIETIEKEAKAKQEFMEKETAARQQVLDQQTSAQLAVIHNGSASGDQSLMSQNMSMLQQFSLTRSLPPLDLPKFDGSPWKYTEFMERFKSMIDSRDTIDVTEKHTYFRMCLEGEAEKAIRHIPVTKDCYEEAKDTLKQSFYRPSTCQMTLIRRLNDLSCNKSSFQSQLDMTREARALVRELLCIDPDDKMKTTQLSLLSKYTEKIQEHIHKKSKESTLSILDMLKAIETYLVDKIDIQSSIQSFHRPSNSSRSNEHRSHSNYEERHNTTASPVQFSLSPSNNRFKNCVFCHKHDNSVNCNTVHPIQDRINFLRDNKICSCCLLPGHTFCSATCAKCNQAHHAAICSTQGTGSNAVPLGPSNRGYHSRNHSKNNQGVQNQQTMALAQVETPILPSTNAQNATALHSMQADNQFRSQPKMWTGNVLVKNTLTEATTHADYMMDSGAMCTFITQNLATELNLTPTSSCHMEIDLAGGGKIPREKYDITKITLCKDQYETTLKAVVYKNDSLTGLLTNTSIPECDLKYLSECENNVNLSDAPDRSNPVKPQILISVSDTMRMLKDGGTIKRLPSGMTMIPTYLGNIIGGEEHSPREFTNHDKRSSEPLPTIENHISAEIPEISGKIIETRDDKLYIGFIQPTTESMKAFAVDEHDPDIGRQVMSFNSLNNDDSPILFYAPNSKPNNRRPKAKKKNENDPIYRVQLNATTFTTLSNTRKLKPWQIRALTEQAEEKAKVASESDPSMLASLALNEPPDTLSNVAPREIIDIPLSAITSKLSKAERTRIWNEKHKKKVPEVRINAMSIDVETNQDKCYEMVDNNWKNEGQLTGSKEQWLAAYKAIPRPKYGIDRWKLSSVLFDRTNPMTTSSHVSDVP